MDTMRSWYLVSQKYTAVRREGWPVGPVLSSSAITGVCYPPYFIGNIVYRPFIGAGY
jgi:hypothetical protein